MNAGEAFLADTPVLRGHAGTQPDLCLAWNASPPDAPSIDVVVHLHGFSQPGGRSGVPHAYGAVVSDPVLLADPAADTDWSRG
jgi:hypothetical protein